MAYVEDQQLPIGASHPSLGNNKSADGVIEFGLLGEDVEFGNVLYHSNDGKWYKAIAESDDKMPVKAIACWKYYANKVIPIMRQGFIRNDNWIYIQGKELFVSTSTAGEITTKYPTDYRQCIGEVDKSNIVYFNPEINYHYGYNERTVVKDLQTDVNALFERQQQNYVCKIWETDAGTLKPIIKTGKHVRLNVLDASVTVNDNSGQEQSVEIIGITNLLKIANTYDAGVMIPLDVIRKSIGMNEQIEVYASGGRRVTVELLCESAE